MPLISVIVPAYNAERTILDTIRSVQQQTFRDLELIVVDDGSTDRTLELVERVAEPRLRVVSQPNAGVSAARNRGIALAAGACLTFLDADDLWMPEKLERQWAALEAHPGAGVAYSWTYFIDEDGRLLYAQDPVFYEGDVLKELLVRNFIASGSNVLVRREAIEASGGFDPDLNFSADWEFCVRLAARSPFVVVPEYHILYRQSSSSMSTRLDLVWEQKTLLAIERAFRAISPNLQPLKVRRTVNAYLYAVRRCLAASPDAEGIRLSGERLWWAVRQDPRILLQAATLRLVVKWLLLRLLPARIALPLIERVRRLRTGARASPWPVRPADDPAQGSRQGPRPISEE